MHMMALRYGDDIIVIDCGMMFPEDELLGVDIVTPDLTYLERTGARSRAAPHARPRGPYRRRPVFSGRLNVPVYGTAFTLALVERRLEEYDAREEPQLHTVKPQRDRARSGPFKSSSSM